jgi:hypothetical protein
MDGRSEARKRKRGTQWELEFQEKVRGRAVGSGEPFNDGKRVSLAMESD